jgi:hypothetical protein
MVISVVMIIKKLNAFLALLPGMIIPAGDTVPVLFRDTVPVLFRDIIPERGHRPRQWQ